MSLPRPAAPVPLPGSRWLIFMTVVAVYICMIDRIAISIAIIPMAEENGWSPTVQGAVMSAFFLGYVTLQIPADICQIAMVVSGCLVWACCSGRCLRS